MSAPAAHTPMILLALLLVIGCRGEGAPEIRTSTAAAESPIEAETLTVSIPMAIPAQLYVEHDAAIVARTSGMIDTVLVDLGSAVAQGQLLARLEDADQRIELDRAQTNAENARRILHRSRTLAESGYVARADSELAQFEAQQAELALRKAQRDFDLTRIIAPFGGVVTSRMARPRRMVEPGDSLFQVTALAPLLLSVRVPESAASSIRIGSQVSGVTSQGRRVSARVIRASPTIDAGSGTREAVLRVEGGGGLRAGETIKIFLGGDPRPVVVIPAEAVNEEGYVLVWENGRSVMRQVQVGAEMPDGKVEIISGLEPGERLLRSPQ